MTTRGCCFDCDPARHNSSRWRDAHSSLSTPRQPCCDQKTRKIRLRSRGDEGNVRSGRRSGNQARRVLTERRCSLRPSRAAACQVLLGGRVVRTPADRLGDVAVGEQTAVAERWRRRRTCQHTVQRRRRWWRRLRRRWSGRRRGWEQGRRRLQRQQAGAAGAAGGDGGSRRPQAARAHLSRLTATSTCRPKRSSALASSSCSRLHSLPRL